jgi:CRP/FNR family transcriptional regulator
MADFLTLVRELAFDSLEIRLRHKLLEQCDANNCTPMTHQALAAEIGSTREVVSRRLKEFEHLGWIKLHRGRIELSNIKALERDL